MFQSLKQHSLYRIGIAVIMLVAVLIPASLSNSWMVSCIGDEWAIYERAERVALGKVSLIKEIFDPLSMGMWAVHKPFLTFYQGMALHLFGINNFGWRMSSIAAFALSIPALFIFAQTFLTRRAALLASALMGCCYFLMAESLWGYGWTPLRLFALWHGVALIFFLKQPRAVSAIALGCTSTLCALSGALCSYIPPLTLVIVMFFCGVKREKSVYRYSAVVVLVYLLTNTIPTHLWSRTDDFRTTLELTLGKTSLGPVLKENFGFNFIRQVEGPARTIPDFLTVFCVRFGQTIAAPLTYDGVDHYVFGRIMDPATAVFSLLGLVYAIYRAWGSQAWRILLLFYLIAVVLAGGLSPYPYPAITRIHFLVPFWAFFAAAAFDMISKKLPRYASNLIAIGLVGSSLWWSYERLYINLPHTPRFSQQAFAMELVQAMPDRRLAFLFSAWHPLDFALKGYGLSDRALQGDAKTSPAILDSIASDPHALAVLPAAVPAETTEMVRSRLCADRSECTCQPCGGFKTRPLTVCGTFECPVLQSQ